MGQSRDVEQKPVVLLDYNSGIKGEQLSSIQCSQKTLKWHKMIFFYQVRMVKISALLLQKYDGSPIQLQYD